MHYIALAHRAKSTTTKWAKLINFMANLRKKVSLDMIKTLLHAITKKVGLGFLNAKYLLNNLTKKSFNDFSEHFLFDIFYLIFELAKGMLIEMPEF